MEGSPPVHWREGCPVRQLRPGGTPEALLSAHPALADLCESFLQEGFLHFAAELRSARGVLPPHRCSPFLRRYLGHFWRHFCHGKLCRGITMKKFLIAMALLASVAVAQDKPRVFVQGKGSEDTQSSGSGVSGHHFGAWGSKSTTDSHDEGMEVSKDLQKSCPEVTVTLNQSAADYVVMLNRESKKNRGLLRSNSQVEVANRLGDVLGNNATHTVGNASKDACHLIMADWAQHGRLAAPDATVSAAPAPAPAPAPATLQTVSVSTDDSAQVPEAPAPAPSNSLGDAAKRQQQLKACQDLAKDNPSIVCK
jgi:hypothetical protein